jgi:ribosomal protein S27AE
MIAITVFGVLFCWLALGIALCIWVYRDAQDRGMDGALWLIVVIFTGPIGLILYLLLRSEPRPYSRPPPPPPPLLRRTRFCTRCGREVSLAARFCPQCGHALEP